MQVAIVGGDGRSIGPGLGPNVTLRCFPSSRYGGCGAIRSARAAIAGGSINLVIFRIDLLGHSDERALVAACKAARVQFRRAGGGSASAIRSIQQYLEQDAVASRATAPTAHRLPGRAGPNRPAPGPNRSARRSRWARKSRL
jgi:hypothetical protein